MVADYESIRAANLRAYGEQGALKIGKLTSELLYADRAHFIYEVLQNAEDALGRRGGYWSGERSVMFTLYDDRFCIEHCGDPFTAEDVRVICEFSESTKSDNITEIGRFGIGFKSVYAYTSKPRVHSGDEHFAIGEYIFPERISQDEASVTDRTVFILPFDGNAIDASKARQEIADGLLGLDRRTLLFLRHVDEISWQMYQGKSGCYRRVTKSIAKGIDRISLTSAITDGSSKSEEAEEWLLFSQAVQYQNQLANQSTGHVHVAFLLDGLRAGGEDESIQQVGDCKLYARFMTGLETDLGLLIDGPYRTTLNREGIPSDDSWNRDLINETAHLLVQSLLWLRDEGMLNAAVLRCLPLTDPAQHSRRAFLHPLFREVRKVFRSEQLLPRQGGGYIPARFARMSKSGPLQDMFSSEQLAALYGDGSDWLEGSLYGDVSIRNFLREELDIHELFLETILRRTTADFFEKQSDEWIHRLYKFLHDQRAQRVREVLPQTSLIRLEDGTHIKAESSDKAEPSEKIRVYLPTEHHTKYRTVKRDVCRDAKARGLLRRLGLDEWSPIDDIIDNLLPKYSGASDFEMTEHRYKADMLRIVDVWKSSARDLTKRRKLENKLREVPFVRSVDSCDPSIKGYSYPISTHLASTSISDLIAGVPGYRITDEKMHNWVEEVGLSMLKACGVRDGLNIVKTTREFNENQLAEMRQRIQGSRRITASRGEDNHDWHIEDVERIAAYLPQLESDDRKHKSELLWHLLADLADKDSSKFDGMYSWFYHQHRRCRFKAQFVRFLNSAAWVSDNRGSLHKPSEVLFNELGWEHNDFLLSQIKFKPPVIEELAAEADLPVRWIQLLKQACDAGMTNEQVEDSLGVAMLKTRKSDEQASRESGFADAVVDRQTENTAIPPLASPVVFPPGGPKTRTSAATDRHRARTVTQEEGWQVRRVSRSERGPAGRALADEFRDMVKGDYAQRCQICGRTFTGSNGDQQVVVAHIVRPSAYSAGSHLGNLLALCGWHYALIQFGKWSFMTANTPDSKEIGKDSELFRRVVCDLREQCDDMGNQYRGLPIRFWGVYGEWADEAFPVDETIRYNNPHWEYLCALLKNE